MDYIKINKENWNKRTELHYNSEFYDNENFIKGKTSLNKIELKLLGDIKEQSILHLQCHFGQDSISLARLGGDVVGVDLSDKSIEKAKELNKICNQNVRFINSDVYDINSIINEKFDICFTTYGVIGWLPDLDKWAKVISNSLKENGRLILVEFHPFVWMFDNDFEYFQYNYFNKEVIIESEEGSYASRDDKQQISSYGWNHSLSEVISSLLNNGMEIQSFEEYDFSPYNIFPDMIEEEKNRFRIKKFGDKFPLVYSIVAKKK